MTPHSGSPERLLQLHWLVDQLGAVYEADEAPVYLLSPHAELDGSSPAEAIADYRMDEMLAIIDRLQTGPYV